MTTAPRQGVVAAAAAKKKGFGGGAAASDGGGGGASAAKRIRQPKPELGGIAAREEMLVRRVEALEAAAQRKDEEEDFEARLAALRAAGKAKAAAVASSSPAAGAAAAAASSSSDGPLFAPLPGPLDVIDSTGRRVAPAPASSPSSGGAGAAGGGEGLYDRPPPPLSQTLFGGFGGGGSTISDPALRDAAIGPGQAGLAVGAAALALVIFFVTGAESAGPSRRYQGLRAAQERPSAPAAAALERQAQALEARLAAAEAARAPPPFAQSKYKGKGLKGQQEADLETLEALAVTRAQMFDFEKAEPLLSRLAAARPADAEAWRLLGEVRLLAKDEAGAVAAYTRARELRPDDLKVATGLADAYIANGQQGKAADFVIALRKEVAAAGAAAAAAGGVGTAAAGGGETRAGAAGGGGTGAGVAAEASAAAAATTDEAAADPGAAAAAADPPPPPPYRRVDDVSARLLLGKAYAAWRGHDGDAFAAYDDLIEAYPEDFRGYLAKGVFLKQRGRQGDAERLLLQARFYAPEELKAYVSQRAGGAAKEAAPEAPPDNSS